MGFLLPLSLLVLLAATYTEGGSARRHRAARAQRPRGGSSPAPSETTAPFWLLDVKTWSSDVHCFLTCAGVTRGAMARINAYKGPQSVILEPPILEGRQHTLRCHVTHVFPVGFLVVTLRRGGRVIYSESLERFTGLDLANVTLTYAFPARPNDLGQLVTCHAHLNLDGLVVHSSSAPMALSFFTWNTTSKALASASIAALVGILLAVGAACLRKYLLMQSRA
ncbi:intercellular adhesion molecule 4 isoform X3 [Phyllostomus discolor]|uniref:Intercellular adhesion molecule 4 isoform X3 n=1 Tax=Phyllostomus discolor TaxID=89673 RepID=A0A7E6EAV3_9CHIR|nr:intercellular adhesion molecule 4 isoform X3 [Phyllostomus discolor]